MTRQERIAGWVFRLPGAKRFPWWVYVVLFVLLLLSDLWFWVGSVLLWWAVR